VEKTDKRLLVLLTTDLRLMGTLCTLGRPLKIGSLKVADRLLLKYVFSASVSAVEFDVIKFDKVVLSVDIFVDVSVCVSWM
jgi:hypothetical protein